MDFDSTIGDALLNSPCGYFESKKCFRLVSKKDISIESDQQIAIVAPKLVIDADVIIIKGDVRITGNLYVNGHSVGGGK